MGWSGGGGGGGGDYTLWLKHRHSKLQNVIYIYIYIHTVISRDEGTIYRMGEGGGGGGLYTEVGTHGVPGRGLCTKYGRSISAGRLEGGGHYPRVSLYINLFI